LMPVSISISFILYSAIAMRVTAKQQRLKFVQNGQK
jgi:hypothetical protein